jgi:quercetin 2,3-dioxygenase
MHPENKDYNTMQPEKALSRTLQRADTRGYAHHGWLESRFSFSFGPYYDPEHIHFGALRVLNDDIIAPGMGFGMHPHNNMEIISVPVAGMLEHKDDTGQHARIGANEIQVMSAGSGIRHSEYNPSETEAANFLQIWILPKHRNIRPRYSQKYFDPESKHNRICTVVAPDDPQALWINQVAWISLCDLGKNTEVSYEMHRADHGLYVFLINGDLQAEGEQLRSRDALMLEEPHRVVMKANKDSNILILEIPLIT